MKKIILLLIFFSTLNISAQIFEPVKWETLVEKISETEYYLIANAKLDAGWHLYSQNVPKNGPIPTAFFFEPSDDFELIGKTSEEEGRTVNDPVFKMKIKYFENEVEFKQRIKVLNSKKLIEVIAEVEFMVCNDEQCLPPTYVDLDFSIVQK